MDGYLVTSTASAHANANANQHNKHSALQPKTTTVPTKVHKSTTVQAQVTDLR